MKKILFISLFLVFLLVLPLSNFWAKENSFEDDFIIVYKNDHGRTLIEEHATNISHEFTSIQAVAALLTDEAYTLLERSQNIKSIDENSTVTMIENDFSILPETKSYFTTNQVHVTGGQLPWNIEKMNVQAAWDYGFTGSGVRVAVMDTGISPHPDLNIAGGISTIHYTNSWNDDNGHGTLVAGTIAAKKNETGIVGVAPDVELYAIKALDRYGQGSLISILQGIDWSIKNNIDILNLSFGTDVNPPSLQEMITTAHDHGIMIIAASGNTGNPLGTDNTVNYPAKYEQAIAVAAVDENFNRAYFSSTGKEVEFSSPGVHIVSTYLNNQYATANGTSFAAPHVAGLIALLKEKEPHKSNHDLRKLLKKYAIDLGEKGRDPWFGYGFLQYTENQASVSRIGGSNLYETSSLISKEGWETSEVVILSRGDRFSDALTGVPLAAKYDAPLLLSRSNRLDRFTKDELIRLQTEKVIILGGHLAIDPVVEEAIVDLGIEVERLAGANMHVTAELIAKKVAPNGSDVAIIVSDNRFQDALSVASYAGVRGIPILLANTENLPLATERALKELGVTETLVIGGELAVSTHVKAKLPTAKRIAGHTRFDTNIQAFQHFEPNMNKAYVATSERFQDGLSGAALAAKENVPVILVGNALRQVTREHFINTPYSKVKILGGELAVNANVFNEITDLVR